ncbi:MAG: hypothetical protein A4E57_01327 [Syntrophorhabdaceae bacterium PtaU1.Bin034]|nr:MAG: hypothetical protein A4E57_01327 [Syntrophorhabdaceae bacterium PtaU1.Bin034]
METVRLLEQKTYALFNGSNGTHILSALCRDLLDQQKKTWSDCRKGYESLAHVKERRINYTGFSVSLQHNPGRIKSTVAHVDKAAIGARPCFLCLGNLPQDQKGILYRNKYLILPNPMPVFDCHFTISSIHHRPQAIAGNTAHLLRLMADFGDSWTILYNGPRCGASAPDHLHFQAVLSGLMPIEKEARDVQRHYQIVRVEGATVYRLSRVGREVVILEADEDDLGAMVAAFEGFLKALKTILSTDEEPMMSIAGVHEKGKWRIMVFPRAKHRPEAFFRTGGERVVISPAVIEMGGVLVAPLEKDFERLTATDVEGIYREVSLDGKTVERALKTLSQSL